jgi:CHAT domain-containing protein/tetratricopeptide (TPR) repeat protein
MRRSFSKLLLNTCLSLISCLLITVVFPALAVDRTPNLPSDDLSETLIPSDSPIDRGLALYRQGLLAEAATVWQQAADGIDNPLQKALSLSYLSLAQQELGKWQEAESSIADSIKILQELPQLEGEGLAIFAKALNQQGNLQFALGQTETALTTWQNAADRYTASDDRLGSIGAKLNQVQALQTLGLYRRAQKLLNNIALEAMAEPDSAVKVKTLQSLGIALELSGDPIAAEKNLQEALKIALKLNNPDDTAAVYLSLGNSAKSNDDRQAALDYYQKSAEIAANTLIQTRARLNRACLLVDDKEWTEAENLFTVIESNLSQLQGGGREEIYAGINYADLLVRYETGKNPAPKWQESRLMNSSSQLLAGFVRQAEKLGDRRARAYALGELGKIYEVNQQWGEAARLTLEALEIAQQIDAADILYQWQWQMGRISCRDRQNCRADSPETIVKKQEAIDYYSGSLKSLKSLRSDLVATKLEVQFSFRESVEPIYRQMVSILLQNNNGEDIPQNNLRLARQVIEDLQLAELDNFFRQACTKAKPEQIDRVDPTAAVIYPIILADRLAVIVSLPNRPLTYYETKIEQNEIENKVDLLLQSLHPTASNKKRLLLSQQVYDWLIRPAEKSLAETNVKTLVFVLDGILQNLPMAALHDGKQYLIEKYSLAIAPGLQLIEPRSLNADKLEVLAAGVSTAQLGFSPLPGVEQEIAQISSEVDAKVILNQEFTNDNFQTKLKNIASPIVHLATHGRFSSKREETFLLSWEDRLGIEELDRILSSRDPQGTNPIELLVLSACQTASGDRRAALGLAGVAVQSGARSTLATLWSVNDRSTADLMTEFYRQLQETKYNKAEVVRQAQLYLLRKSGYEHPYYWAPFVLVGNWL